MRTAAETLEKLEEIFDAILALAPGAEQREAARRFSGGDEELAEQALSLAAAHRRRETLNGAARRAVKAEGGAADSETGRLYGRYRTIRHIGSGGMGSVFLAERADGEYRHTVALKIIHPHLAPEVFHRRFLEERQILATLNHPGITKILDGGVTAGGAPYLVMDYIEGQPLDVYCARRGLDRAARLELFRRVCEPVSYAHRSLVIHRDLKPSNVFVTREGNPVLIDFGTARFLEGVPAMEHTAFPLMTLRYSSPEQRSRGHLTTATDVYSLGVMLHELLTGEWPFGDASTPEGLLRSLGGQTQATARGLPDDLRAILVKALAHAPEERYQSVDAFSADLGNFLRGASVQARPAGWAYRARKFAGRNRVALGLGAVAVSALIAANSFALYEASLARDRYAQLRAVTTSLLFDLKNAINDVPGSTAAQKILIDRVLKNLGDLTRASSDPELQFQLAEAYRQLGELQGDPYSQNLGDSAGALRSLGKARAICEAALRKKPADPAWLHLAGMVEITAAETYLGRGDEILNAVASAKRATGYYERMIPLTKDVTWIADAASAYGIFGDILGQSGLIALADPVRAGENYRRAIAINTAVVGKTPGSARSIRGIAVMRMKLGDLARTADPELALVEFRATTAALDGLTAADAKAPAMERLRFYFLRKTGDALRDLREWTEAESALGRAREYHDRQLAADPGDRRAEEDVAVVASDQAYLYLWQGKYRQMLEPAATLERLSGEFTRRHPNDPKWQLYFAFSRVQLAIVKNRLGDVQSAGRLARAGVAELVRLAELPNASPHFHEVAAEWLVAAEPGDARDLRRAVAYARKFLAETRPDNVAALSRLALALEAAGEADEAGEAKTVAGKALALLPPVKEGRVAFLRRELERVTK